MVRRNYGRKRMVEDYYDAANLTDDEIQKVLSVLLKSCSDKALATVVRKIIFGAAYDVDWQEAWDIITEYMPELTQYDDFNSIIRAIKG